MRLGKSANCQFFQSVDAAIQTFRTNTIFLLRNRHLSVNIIKYFCLLIFLTKVLPVLRLLRLILLMSLFVACSSSKRSVQTPPQPGEIKTIAFSIDQPPSLPALARGETTPPTPAEFKQQLGDYGHSWFYGPGIGKTMANVGTVIAFPPYALYLLGNAGLQLAGFEPLYVSEAIPGEAGRYVKGAYENVTSIPGRVTSFVAGEDFQAERKIDE